MGWDCPMGCAGQSALPGNLQWPFRLDDVTRQLVAWGGRSLY